MRARLFPLLSAIACNAAPAPDDTQAPTSPCPQACWSDVDVSTGALYVCPGGDDVADGSWLHPYATIAEGILAARGAPMPVLVAPGSYAESVQLQTASGETTGDDGLSIYGCGGADAALQTVWTPGSEAWTVRVGGAQDVMLSGLEFVGGQRTIWIWQGASVNLAHSVIREPSRVGVLAIGPDTTLEATDVRVIDPVEDAAAGGGFAWGIAADRAHVELSQVSVEGARGVGIYLSGAVQVPHVLTDVSVLDTATDGAGLYGRGLMLQSWAQAEVIGGAFERNTDAGIFSHGASYLSIAGATVADTSAGMSGASGVATGDGVVIHSAQDLAPETFHAVVTGLTVSGSDRAAMVFHGVTVDELAGNTLTANATFNGESVVSQAGAQIPAGSPAAALPEPLGINDIELDLLPGTN